jgi:hypothetical protein
VVGGKRERVVEGGMGTGTCTGQGKGPRGKGAKGQSTIIRDSLYMFVCRV